MTRCSVIIPAHNVAQFVAHATRSALEQTHDDVEVIVVNDGSTDETSAKLQPFLDRIIYVEQDPCGLAAARNVGLQKATGDFIALLDADDWWMPDRLRLVLAYLAANPHVGFATTDAYLVLGETVTRRTFYRPLSYKWRFHPRHQKEWITLKNFVMGMVVLRRSLLERHGAFDESLGACEDWDLWARLIVGGENVGLVNRPLAYYRIRPDSLSLDRDRMAEATDNVLSKLIANEAVRSKPSLRSRVEIRRAVINARRGKTATADASLRRLAADPSTPAIYRLSGLGIRALLRRPPAA